MMKKLLTTALLALCVGFCPAEETALQFQWEAEEIPVIREEPYIAMAFTREDVPVYARQGYVDTALGVDDVTHIFHFTRGWWLRAYAQRAAESRDEATARVTEAAYDLVVAEVMNDVLWLGAPRELVILDEPE